MEKFRVVTTLTERALANRACAKLESAGIPVMLEHVEITRGLSRTAGYRLFVPSQHTQAALRIVGGSGFEFTTRTFGKVESIQTN